jgi:acetyl-CoA C-acetyltransferase
MTNVVILSGARTAIGSFGGSLSKVSPIDMSTATIKAYRARREITRLVMNEVSDVESAA